MVFDHTPPTRPPPNLNYGLFTQNFFTLFFFKCKYDLNLSKWILSKKNIFKILTLRLTACTLNTGAMYISAL